ncbi:hypothetical protein E2P81_ATG04674 [Venturia nashicola]|uniref:Uncharacterized protein n=1 Tax=Venturia nashicola TaxID=86259 RepID=A0A4Z1PGW0_9PEZI|nr:hypothetical protein E6O75_ATG04782 [Venturia nashicola]TLD34509.1 hypothetical protein E2P81_ATG04674 [Venturia nashicola]
MGSTESCSRVNEMGGHTPRATYAKDIMRNHSRNCNYTSHFRRHYSHIRNEKTVIEIRLNPFAEPIEYRRQSCHFYNECLQEKYRVNPR